jgi:hypothetical protein
MDILALSKNLATFKFLEWLSVFLGRAWPPSKSLDLKKLFTSPGFPFIKKTWGVVRTPGLLIIQYY